jgi:hypothetical protein
MTTERRVCDCCESRCDRGAICAHDEIERLERERDDHRVRLREAIEIIRSKATSSEWAWTVEVEGEIAAGDVPASQCVHTATNGTTWVRADDKITCSVCKELVHDFSASAADEHQ